MSMHIVLLCNIMISPFLREPLPLAVTLKLPALPREHLHPEQGQHGMEELRQQLEQIKPKIQGGP